MSDEITTEETTEAVVERFQKGVGEATSEVVDRQP